MQSIKKSAYNFLFWLLVLLIMGLTILPKSALSSAIPFQANSRLDYLIHFLSFLPLPILAFFASQGNTMLKKWKMLMALSFAIAILSELLQLAVEDRTFNPLDILANLSGLLVGLAIIFVYSKWSTLTKKV
jgi:VanZ family protein